MGSGVLKHQLAVPRPGGLSAAQAARAFVAVAWLPQPGAAPGETASPTERPSEARQTTVPTLLCSGLGGIPDVLTVPLALIFNPIMLFHHSAII